MKSFTHELALFAALAALASIAAIADGCSSASPDAGGKVEPGGVRDRGKPGEDKTKPAKPDAKPALLPVGSACKSADQCVGGPGGAPAACATEGWPGGYCNVPDCKTGTCPDGGECFAYGDGARHCLKACAERSDCREGYACSESGACIAACKGESCGAGFLCEETTGRCVREGKSGPGIGPTLSCDKLPVRDCAGTREECSELIAYEPIEGPGWVNYPKNGETAENRYRSFARRDLVQLVQYAAAYVDCKAKGWPGGNNMPLGLGDMSEQTGAIPGTSIGQPGHPAGTHVNGFDMDIAYYQVKSADNRLRVVCPHQVDGVDKYHCTGAPTNLDLWRTSLYLGAFVSSSRVRVIGCDGQIGPKVLETLPALCAEGLVPEQSCVVAKNRITFETTNEGRGWFHFHHHHFHVSLKPLPKGGPSMSVEPMWITPDGSEPLASFARLRTLAGHADPVTMDVIE